MAFLTAAELLTYVNVAAPTGAQTTRATEIAAAIDGAFVTTLEWPVGYVATAADTAELAEAAKLAGAQLWARRSAPFGVTGYADAEGGAIRVASDPIAGVRPMVTRHRAGASGDFG